jgi:photosystem II stability/assembly factor-like uncharacterized protein
LKFRLAILVVVCLSVDGVMFGADWVSLGPEGGDARSLAYDPANSNRIYLGTSAGELFVSSNGGERWTRLAHLGAGNDYVLDNIAVNPKNPDIIYVGAWSVENNSGDVFKSTDGGQTWNALRGIQGKSIRAMAVAPSNPDAIVVGALDGIYRSMDAGETWTKITPVSHPELKNFESIAFDPRDPNIVYAGTWHLPWKTENAGATWTNIKQGILDDSDVFSIIVDQKNPSTVFVSACSGIYKSENAGGQFRKVQGIPFSARRTRVLQQDPQNSSVIYAGTTEGLWKSADSGTSWKRVSSPSVIVNDVLVDPRNPQLVMLATDRTGILMSRDGGNTLVGSNRGFSHRQVMAVVADNSKPDRLYVALINNRELGGLFVSNDVGSSWSQLNAGLGKRDIFSLDQAESGTLVAGTNQGLFALKRGSDKWVPINVRLIEKSVSVPVKNRKKGQPKITVKRTWTKSEISARVSEIRAGSDRWYAATSQGLFRSNDHGTSWVGGPVLGNMGFVAVDAAGDTVLAATATSAMLSRDGGETWTNLTLPPYVSRVNGVTVGPRSDLWIQTHMGSFRTHDFGTKWEHVTAGTPPVKLWYVRYDHKGDRLIAIAGARNTIFESRDGGDSWQLAASAHYPIRNVALAGSRMLAVTEFNGVVAQPVESGTVAASGGSK